MKFPYIPLDVLLDEAIGEASSMYQQGLFIRDDAYNYAIEAAKLVGGNAYDTSWQAIEINKHLGFLPQAFYTANSVWRCDDQYTKGDQCPGSVLDYFRSSVGWHRKAAPMWPADPLTQGRMTMGYKNLSYQSPEEYWFKKNTIRTSFMNGFIAIHYNHLPVDERGVILVQDEVNNLIGIKTYIKYKALEQPFYMGKVNAGIWDRLEKKALDFIDQANAIQKFPDPAAMDKTVDEVNNRYKDFKL